MQALASVRDVGIPDAYIAAGAIRNTVWDVLEQGQAREPHGDVDVVYYDPSESARDWKQALAERASQFQWEVTNQATVHRWQGRALGRELSPYSSVADALRAWPETATAVAARLLPSEEIAVLAPFGLQDLFGRLVRRNELTPDGGAFARRVAAKQWSQRWANVRIVDV